ncbi:MAG: translation initiation factor IF-3 [Candidatus Magasanikbacteria bacterium]
MDNYKVNKDIRANEVRVINPEGENLGVFDIETAIKKAKEREKDLIEIVPDADPPVTKIYDFDKFRYEKEKEQKKKKQKTKEMKRIGITPSTAEHDMKTKVSKIESFLEDGHRVEVGIFLKGREKANKDFAKDKLNDFLDMIDVPFKVTMEPKYTGQGFDAQIVKN